ncbi:MAG TPA: DUF1343 domain-containing protein [Melioribacteraceae bacterium]|nr:DUF1343 domain-containing protein [Melioribacteraceae bacterium]
MGIDLLERDNFTLLENKRIALITNQTGLNSRLVSTVDLLSRAENLQLVSVYSPEHGFHGLNTAGESVEDFTDSTTGIKYYSLYGKRTKPTREMLTNIDAIVYDIQDIGCRAYTYITTLGLAMEAAAESGKEFIILDRPNPLGGLRIEGNIVEDGFTSFVSPFKIPYVYGLTCGELATLINEEGMLKDSVKCKLHIVKMVGWERWMHFYDTGLIWVPSSTNVPYSSTPFYLVGSGILGELVTISIGISYTLPFQTFAAEWIDPDTLSARMNDLKLKGVRFRPIIYRTNYGIWIDKILKGVQIHITDYDKVNLMELQFYFMEVHNNLYPDKKIFDLTDSTRIKMFDKVMGTDRVRILFSRDYKVDAIKDYLRKDLTSFRNLSGKYFLYN